MLATTSRGVFLRDTSADEVTVFRDYRSYSGAAVTEYVMAPYYQWEALTYTATHVVSGVT